MSLHQAIMHEIMYYEKRYGKKPAMLILCDVKTKDDFFSKLYESTLNSKDFDFHEPGKFMGVPFAFKNIQQYAGFCKWMIVGEI